MSVALPVSVTRCIRSLLPRQPITTNMPGSRRVPVGEGRERLRAVFEREPPVEDHLPGSERIAFHPAPERIERAEHVGRTGEPHTAPFVPIGHRRDRAEADAAQEIFETLPVPARIECKYRHVT